MKKIMIIGAGMLQTYVIKRAKELGYTVIAVDRCENAEGFAFCDFCKAIDIVDEKACLAYAKEMKIDGVLTAATDYGVLTTAYIAENLNLPGIPYSVAKVIKNKYEIRRMLHEKGVESIGQFFEISKNESVEKFADKIKFPVIVKPCDASGSRGVAKISDLTTLKQACKEAMDCSLTSRALIETFIEGEEYGVESFVRNGEVHVLAVMKKRMTKPPYYAELGHSLPSGLSEQVENRFRKSATDIIKALGITNGSVNMDFILDKENNPFVVDIGARMGGNLIGSHIVPYSTGIDYMGNMIKCAVGDFDKADFSPKRSVQITTAILNLQPGIEIKEIPNRDDIYKAFPDVKYIKLHIEKGMTVPVYKNNLDGCGYVVVEGEDVAKNIAVTEQVKKCINVVIGKGC